MCICDLELMKQARLKERSLIAVGQCPSYAIAYLLNQIGLTQIREFLAGHQVELFRIELSTQRTEYVVTNDHSQDSAAAARQENTIRWKIEQFHRFVLPFLVGHSKVESRLNYGGPLTERTNILLKNDFQAERDERTAIGDVIGDYVTGKSRPMETQES